MTVLEATAAPTSVPAVPARPVRFTGHSRAYWRILIRGAVLLAITLGIYRFWLATDIRRFLWAHTEAGGQSFEYTGTALELLIGFLISLEELQMLVLLFFLVALGLGEFGGLISVLAFVVLAFLGQYAVYRARRYRLTRTVFRGVRFHQGGSAWRFAICAIFWWAVIVLTLGLAYPFAQAALERYKMQHTHYGNLTGGFVGSGFRLLMRGLPMWLLVMGPLVFALWMAIAAVDWLAVADAVSQEGGDVLGRIEGASPGFYQAIVVAITAAVVSALVAALLFPAFQAMVLRWWLSGLRLDRLSLRSHLRTGQIYGAYLRFLLYAVLLLIAVGITFVAASAIFYAIHGEQPSEAVQIAGAIGLLVFYVMTMLGFSTIYQGTVKLALWRHGVESVEIDGLPVLDHVKAEGGPSSAVGEGLADALNVGGL